MEKWKEGRGRGGGDPWILTGWAPLPYRRSCERRTYAIGKERDASGVTSTIRGPALGSRAVVGSGGPADVSRTPLFGEHTHCEYGSACPLGWCVTAWRRLGGPPCRMPQGAARPRSSTASRPRGRHRTASGVG